MSGSRTGAGSPAAPSSRAAAHALVVDGVSVTFLASSRARGGPLRALVDVSLTVPRGVVVAVVGPNGAGKSTLLRTMTGDLRPRVGAVRLDGAPVSAMSRADLARSVAVVEQSPGLPAGFTVEDVVALGRLPHHGLLGAPGDADRAAVAQAMTEAGVDALALRTVETLSGGERQRVVLARALAQRTPYLLLDEPTNHLDLRYQLETLAFARRSAGAGAGVLIVLHDLNLAARVADVVVVLAGGRVVATGDPRAVLTQPLLAAVYGAAVRVIDDAGTPVVVPGTRQEGQ